MLLHVTFFTLGHSVSLGLATYKVFAMDSAWVEFLIPVTILATGVVSLVNATRKKFSNAGFLFTALTFFFGMIHGFGFAGYFNMINEGNVLVHLLEFALGIELAQVVIALAVVILAFIAQDVLKLRRRYWVVTLSAVVILLAIPMLIENWIF